MPPAGPAPSAAAARRRGRDQKGGGPPAPRPAARLIRVAEVPIGIFGLVDLSRDELPAPLSQTDPVAAARAEVAGLRARGARLIVGLFHLKGGTEQARQLAKEADGIDVVVVG